MIIFLHALPIPPSCNKAYPTGRHGRRFVSQELKDWREEVNSKWYPANIGSVREGQRLCLNCEKEFFIEISCSFFFLRPTILTLDGYPKKKDVSNLLKPLHDAVSGLINIDDRYFWCGSYRTSLTKTVHEYVDVILRKHRIVF